MYEALKQQTVRQLRETRSNYNRELDVLARHAQRHDIKQARHFDEAIEHWQGWLAAVDRELQRRENDLDRRR